MNFFSSMSLAEEFRIKLQSYQSEHPTAKHQGKNECCKSGVCCWRRPGALAPEDIPILAKYLNITEQELFKQFLVVDEITGYRVLLPKRVSQEGGRMLSCDETYDIDTPCVFLDTKDNSCKVHKVKPIACKNFKCWEPKEPDLFPEISDQKLSELGWNGSNPDFYSDSDY